MEATVWGEEEFMFSFYTGIDMHLYCYYKHVM